jgi:hypothetical protein
LACAALLLVTAAMLAVPLCNESPLPAETVAPLPANFRLNVGLVDPATIGSEDRAEMSLPPLDEEPEGSH